MASEPDGYEQTAGVPPSPVSIPETFCWPRWWMEAVITNKKVAGGVGWVGSSRGTTGRTVNLGDQLNWMGKGSSMLCSQKAEMVK